MMLNKSWSIVAVTLAFATGVGVYLANDRRHSDAEPEADAYRKLLATTLPDSQGKAQALAQWQGRVLVVNFWASWCPPCREEMPALSRLQTRHASSGVRIIGIALDNAANVSQYAARHPTKYPLLVGNPDTSELTRKMGNTQMALPYTAVFDAKGGARMTRLGLFSEEELDALLKTLTAE